MIIQKYFEERTEFLNKVMDEYLTPKDEQPGVLYEAIRYSIFNGGKRLRPILMMSTFEMLNKTDTYEALRPALPAAAAIEMIHTASLIHDDLPSMDDSDERRGQQSLHKKYNPAVAILAGDALLTKAFEVLARIEDKEKACKCISILCQAVSTRGMIGGQTVDVISSDKNNIQINVLKYIHSKKTGALLEASVKLACAMAGADDNITNTLSTYAMNLGLAYQIIDDILDDVGDFEMLGKEPYEDARNNKSTYPSIMGLDKARRSAEKLLDDSFKLVKNFPKNQILVEFVRMIKDRLP